MLDGTPIFPINWLFNANNVTANKTNGGLLIVDPGDSSNNIATTINNNQINSIRSTVIRSINHLRNENSSSLFE